MRIRKPGLVVTLVLFAASSLLLATTEALSQFSVILWALGLILFLTALAVALKYRKALKSKTEVKL